MNTGNSIKVHIDNIQMCNMSAIDKNNQFTWNVKSMTLNSIL